MTAVGMFNKLQEELTAAVAEQTRYCEAIQEYVVLELDQGGCVINHDDELTNSGVCVMQPKGSKLELWKTSVDNTKVFVYSNDLGIGYWVVRFLIREL